MTVLDQVKDFIVSRAPKATCDDCIADGLRLSIRQHANHKTRELAEAYGFDRHFGTCTICKREKKVISYVKRS